jgi:hypothetical protein
VIDVNNNNKENNMTKQALVEMRDVFVKMSNDVSISDKMLQYQRCVIEVTYSLNKKGVI